MLRDLTERITITSRSAGSGNGLGGGAVSTSVVATVWARVVPPRQQPAERAVNDVVVAERMIEFEIAYRADVGPAMFVSWTPYRASSARTLEIQAVTPAAGGHERVRLHCAEVDA